MTWSAHQRWTEESRGCSVVAVCAGLMTWMRLSVAGNESEELSEDSFVNRANVISILLLAGSREKIVARRG